MAKKLGPENFGPWDTMDNKKGRTLQERREAMAAGKADKGASKPGPKAKAGQKTKLGQEKAKAKAAEKAGK